MTYASFWKRVAAFIVDYIIYAILCITIEKILRILFEPTLFASSVSYAILFMGLSKLSNVLCYLCYFVYPESSHAQATWGKRLLGLKVTDLNGNRISFVRSLGRNLGIFVSFFTLGVGCLICLWTSKKQCLHDQMAGCLIEDKCPQRRRTAAFCIIGATCIFMIVSFLGIYYVMLPQLERDVIQFYQGRIHQEQVPNNSSEN